MAMISKTLQARVERLERELAGRKELGQIEIEISFVQPENADPVDALEVAQRQYDKTKAVIHSRLEEIADAPVLEARRR